MKQPAYWVETANSVPTWDEAYERLVAEERLSRVEHPSIQEPFRQEVRQTSAEAVDRRQHEADTIGKIETI
jgi:hypothetical protein